jgi:hypothetical protein
MAAQLLLGLYQGGTVLDDADLTLTLSKIAGARVELFGAWGCGAGGMT